MIQMDIFIDDDGGDPMANVMASIRSGQIKLRKAKVEERKPVAGKNNYLFFVQFARIITAPADPMASMIASIRSGNVALKKVQKETKVFKSLSLLYV